MVFRKLFSVFLVFCSFFSLAQPDPHDPIQAKEDKLLQTPPYDFYLNFDELNFLPIQYLDLKEIKVPFDKLRGAHKSYPIDSCMDGFEEERSFSSVAKEVIAKSLIPESDMTQADFRSAFSSSCSYDKTVVGIYSKAHQCHPGSELKAGLAQYPFCEGLSVSDVEAYLKKDRSLENFRKEGAERLVADMNAVSAGMNRARELALKEGNKDFSSLEELWTGLMGCLGHIESLDTRKGLYFNLPSLFQDDMDEAQKKAVVDSYYEERVAEKNSKEKALKDYMASLNLEAPADVKVYFYMRKGQSKPDDLTLGLYQFENNPAGNIQGCIDKWNRTYGTKKDSSGNSCYIAKNRAAVTRALMSPQQSFNIFCGIHKLQQSFAIQAHMSVGPKNKSAKANEKCVTPFIYAGLGYMHYGSLHLTAPSIPLTNGTAKAPAATDKFLSCMKQNLKEKGLLDESNP